MQLHVGRAMPMMTAWHHRPARVVVMGVVWQGFKPSPPPSG
jgi:hypothetical protein